MMNETMFHVKQRDANMIRCFCDFVASALTQSKKRF